MDRIRAGMEAVERQLLDLQRRSIMGLGNLPEGSLRHTYKNGRVCYRNVTKTSGGKYERRFINKNPELIRQLAAKEYLRELKEAADHNLILLNEMMQGFRSMDPEDLIASMGGAAQTVAAGEFLPLIGRDDAMVRERMARHRAWAMAEYRKSSYKPEEKIHLTSAGIYVRSKSEVLIAEKLLDMGIPFRYEQEIYIDGKWYAPDFTFQDAKEKLFFWEHAGMMSDPDYVRKHTLKMGHFQHGGIVPWENLIVTYDQQDGAINMAEISSRIKYGVLPRL